MTEDKMRDIAIETILKRIEQGHTHGCFEHNYEDDKWMYVDWDLFITIDDLAKEED